MSSPARFAKQGAAASVNVCCPFVNKPIWGAFIQTCLPIQYHTEMTLKVGELNQRMSHPAHSAHSGAVLNPYWEKEANW